MCPEFKITSRSLLRHSPPRRRRSQILNKLLGASWLALPHWKQVQPLALAALTRQDLGTCSDIVTVPQPLGLLDPMAQGHLMTTNTRSRPDTFSGPEDEQARSAVLLRFQCEKHQIGITNWINNLWDKSNTPAHNKPVRIHCKAISVSARLVFETKAMCQDFVARRPCEIHSPCCFVKTTILVRQSTSLEDPEIGKQLAPMWRALAEQIKFIFLDGDNEGAFNCKAGSVSARLVFSTRASCQAFVALYKDDGTPYEIDTLVSTSKTTFLVRHSRSTEDRETGKQFMPLRLEVGKRLLFFEPDLCVPGVSSEVLQWVVSQSSQATG